MQFLTGTCIHASEGAATRTASSAPEMFPPARCHAYTFVHTRLYTYTFVQRKQVCTRLYTRLYTRLESGAYQAELCLGHESWHDRGRASYFISSSGLLAVSDPVSDSTHCEHRLGTVSSTTNRRVRAGMVWQQGGRCRDYTE